MLNVNVNGLVKVDRMLRRVEVEVPKRVLKTFAKETYKNMKRLAPYRGEKKEGSYKKRLKLVFHENEAWIVDPTGHGKFFIWGTKTPILPKRRKYLTFKSRGRWYRKKKVRGQKPRDIITPSLNLAASKTKIELKKVLMGV